MATISQIQIGDQTYNIHDAVMGSRFNNGVLQRAYGGTGQTTADALDGNFSQQEVINNFDDEAYFTTDNTSITNGSIRFGTGSSNKGIYNTPANNWVIRTPADASNSTFIPDWDAGNSNNNRSINATITCNKADNYTVCSLTIQKSGLWMIQGLATFTGNTGIRIAQIRPNTNNTNTGELGCVGGFKTSNNVLSLSPILFVDKTDESNKTYYLKVYTAQADITVKGILQAYLINR